jgi:uroporphyrinogen-III decarboxylase
MTGKERMTAAFRGEPVDRVPIWLREGFDFHLPTPDAEDFALGWRADPDYRSFCEYAAEFCDLRVNWSPGGHFNRVLGIDPRHIETETRQIGPDTRHLHTVVHTPQGDLEGIKVHSRGENTTWSTKYPVETLGDLDALRALPFEVAPTQYDGYDKLQDVLGDRGVACLGLSSPWVVFSTVTTFENALMWSATDRETVHDVLGEITDRYLACLDVLFARPLDTVANIGGSEQCTPPMMGPDAYAEFVTPYESRIVAFLKERNVLCNCHCHGRISHVLPLMVTAGFDATDPVEPPNLGGDGDVSIREARDAVDDRLTLCGNVQFDEFERSTAEQIRERVREIIDTGKRRLVLSASAGPTNRASEKMIENYYALVDEAVAYGQA